MIFIDTNYFLRLLLKDVEEQYQEAKLIFQKGAQGEIKLFTSLIVFFEIYWVLVSNYGERKNKIIEILSGILKMDFIKIDKRETLREALRIFSQENLDLEDSYNLVYAKQEDATAFKSFDKKLRRLFG